MMEKYLGLPIQGGVMHLLLLLLTRVEVAILVQLAIMVQLAEVWLLLRRRPGADPTKHEFSNFTHICKIFLQTCANL
jgi:hypothetical protein